MTTTARNNWNARAKENKQLDPGKDTSDKQVNIQIDIIIRVRLQS